MMLRLKRWFVDILIRITERELYTTPVMFALDDDRRQKLFATLWETPGFREYLMERETRIVYALAQSGKDTMKGQRIEVAILFQRAKQAFRKQQEALAKRRNEEENVASPRKR